MLFTRKASLKVSLISLILILSLTEASHAHRHESYSHDGGRQTCQPCWMKYLNDNVRLSELSIPGTHESMSFYGGPLVQCQSMALHFQLESGIRVLDIRCAVAENNFNIYHGRIYQKATFANVLDWVMNFLEKHPSETVLMRVKEEHTDQCGRFEEIFRTRYWNHPHYGKKMWKGKDPNPTLGEMRGKIVILQDFARWDCGKPCEAGLGKCGTCGAGCTTPDKARYGICYCSFDIEDTFGVPGEAFLYDKWLAVKKQLERANTGPTNTKFMTYLSGAGTQGSLGIPHPFFVVSGHVAPGATNSPRQWTGYRMASNQDVYPNFPREPCPYGIGKCIFYEGTNTLTYGALGTYYQRVGIIMTDFPGWGLINRIIDLNKPFRKPNQRLECGEENPKTCKTASPKRRS